MRGWGEGHRCSIPVRLNPPQLCTRRFLHLHDHLTTSEERVADELARAQSNLRVGHVGRIRPATRQLAVSHKYNRAGLGLQWTYWTEIDLAVVDYLWLAGGKMEMSNLLRRVGGRQCASLSLPRRPATKLRKQMRAWMFFPLVKIRTYS